jgi:hypothetical protein
MCYTYGIMKKILTFTVEQPKHRAHRVLFQNNTPFMPKVVKSKKNEFKRNPKHRNKNEY